MDMGMVALSMFFPSLAWLATTPFFEVPSGLVFFGLSAATQKNFKSG